MVPSYILANSLEILNVSYAYMYVETRNSFFFLSEKGCICAERESTPTDTTPTLDTAAIPKMKHKRLLDDPVSLAVVWVFSIIIALVIGIFIAPYVTKLRQCVCRNISSGTSSHGYSGVSNSNRCTGKVPFHVLKEVKKGN